MTRRPSATCQCRRWTTEHGPCKRVATAEDLLCDVCRTGCRRTSVGGHSVAFTVIPHTPSGTARPSKTDPANSG